MEDNFKNALIGVSINQSIPFEDDIFGRFIGKWNFDLKVFDPKKKTIKSKGSWIFESILNGLAVQDIWTVPLQESKDGKSSFYEYGTSIRSYDLKTKKWKVTWIGPIQNQHFIFDVGREEDEIHLTLIDDYNFKMKWIFYDIKEEKFKWKSKIFLSNKCEWFTNCHMSVSKVYN